MWLLYVTAPARPVLRVGDPCRRCERLDRPSWKLLKKAVLKPLEACTPSYHGGAIQPPSSPLWKREVTDTGVSHRELYYLVVLSILRSGGRRWAVETIWEIKPGTSPLVFKYHTGFVGLEISMKGNEEEEEEQVEEEMQGLALRNSPEYPQCPRRTNRWSTA
ncbi:unnamed protein product [Gadus morhua 'NCC']